MRRSPPHAAHLGADIDTQLFGILLPARCAGRERPCHAFKMLMPGIYPDYRAPVVRKQPEGCELIMARWGMPSPLAALKGRKADSGVTNIRNVESPHWRR